MNGIRITQEEAERRFEEKGIKLESKYINNQTKVQVICHCGKEFSVLPCTIFRGLTKGCGCKNNRVTREEAERRSKEKGVVLIKYTTARELARFRCRCGKEFDAMPWHIFMPSRVRVSCGCSRLEQTLTQEEAENRFWERGVRLKGKYVNYSTKVSAICRCGKEFEALPQIIFRKYNAGCGCLRGRNLMPEEEVEKKLGEKGIKAQGRYMGTNKRMQLICHCGKPFMASPGHIFTGRTLSCGCMGRSVGENLVEKCLEKYGCQFVQEWTREGIRRFNSLRYDFYLPLHNAIIEFNGRQHFKPTFFVFNGRARGRQRIKEEAEKELAKLQDRDKEKRDWAAANGIPLLDINYDEIDQVEDKVWNFLMELRQRKASMAA